MYLHPAEQSFNNLFSKNTGSTSQNVGKTSVLKILFFKTEFEIFLVGRVNRDRVIGVCQVHRSHVFIMLMAVSSMSILKWWYSTNSGNCFRFRIGTMTAVLLEAQEDSSYKLARFRWWQHHDSFSTVKILSISAWTIARSLALRELSCENLASSPGLYFILFFRSPFIALRPTNKHLEEAVSAALAMAIVEPTSMLCCCFLFI